MSRDLTKIRVPPYGDPHAKIMLVGEGPGRQEAQSVPPRPFIGKAGNELDRYLNAEGILRDKCWITNVTKYLPNTKEKDDFFFLNEQPTEHMLAGIIELRDEIKRVKPDVIIAFGNIALYALTGKGEFTKGKLTGITKWRGSPLPCVLASNTWVIPTLHPAFIIRGQWHLRPFAAWDIRKAKRISETKDFSTPKREYTIFPTNANVRAEIKRLSKVEIFATDTEWYTSEDLSCIGFSDDPSRAICIQADHPLAKEAYEALLTCNSVRVFQHGMFDVVNLRRHGWEVKLEDEDGKRLIEDTMIAFHFSWQDLRKKDLGTIQSIYTDEPHHKDDLKISRATGDPEQEYIYNCTDNVVTLESWHGINDDMDWMGTRQAYENSMMNFDIMADAALHGIRIDMDRHSDIRKQLNDGRTQFQAVLDEILGQEINVRSHTQVGSIVYEVLGCKVQRGMKRNTRQETIMDICANTDDAATKNILMLIIALRHRNKILSSYMKESFIDPDGYMRFSWNLCGTKNGRYSAAKTYWGSGVPIQQIPMSIRSMFVPDEGYLFALPDAEQAEARVVAHITDDLKVLEWMEKDLDIHRMLAVEMFDVVYDEIAGESKVRYVAKQCRHALNYKMMPNTFRLTVNKKLMETGIGISRSESEEYRNLYMSIHPNLRFWWKEVEQELKKNSAITNAFGRRRRFYQSWGDDLIRDAIACEPQGTIGDLTHFGIRAIADEIPEAKVLVNMHDGAVVQIPENNADEYAKRITEAMTIPFKLRGSEVTIPISTPVATSWIKE